jgi:hypothetical protein
MLWGEWIMPRYFSGNPVGMLLVSCGNFVLSLNKLLACVFTLHCWWTAFFTCTRQRIHCELEPSVTELQSCDLARVADPNLMRLGFFTTVTLGIKFLHINLGWRDTIESIVKEVPCSFSIAHLVSLL